MGVTVFKLYLEQVHLSKHDNSSYYGEAHRKRPSPHFYMGNVISCGVAEDALMFYWDQMEEERITCVGERVRVFKKWLDHYCKVVLKMKPTPEYLAMDAARKKAKQSGRGFRDDLCNMTAWSVKKQVKETSNFVWFGVYHEHQCYGGPEEGGWWYDAGPRVAVWKASKKAARALRRTIRKEVDELNGELRDYHSTRSEGRYSVHESHECPPEHYSNYFPYC